MDNISPPIIEQEPETMDFYQALKLVAKGFTIRRISWPETDYGLLVETKLTIHTKEQFFSWTVNDGDMEATDWIVRETN